MSTITATAASFTKLRNGSWGIKGHGLAAGKTVTVAKRSGDTSMVTVDRIIWTDGTIAIASIKSDRVASTTPARSRHSYAPVRRQIRNGYCQSCGNQSWDCDC